MIDFKEVDYEGDSWELFARDFLEEVGFFIESTPDRGPDGGKDLLVSEELKGKLNKYRFRWLVSCKHFATSGRSVAEKDEPNILERLSSFGADGFIGFYSTVPSSGLNTRLNDLKKELKIKDFRIFDQKIIENYLIRIGYSKLIMRYLPESYKIVKPLHKVLDEYIPLTCEVCGKDLLEALYRENYKGIIAQASDLDEKGVEHVKKVYCACKGACDKQLRDSIYKKYKLTTSWKDISDLAIPLEFLRYVISAINQLHDGEYHYEKDAFEKEKQIIISLAQKVLRETTEKEKERVVSLMSFPF
ncbi:MAG: restriction endonuclease [Deltaproteobacteria bacterium]|nr:restriction endonuclease [Deltaproteobacteria bacterium]